MTTIAHKTVTAEAPGADLVVRKGAALSARRARRQLSLTWTISREAAATAGLAGAEGGPVVLRIRLAWKRGVEGLHASLIDGETLRELEVMEPGAGWASADGLFHLDLPGILHVSVR